MPCLQSCTESEIPSGKCHVLIQFGGARGGGGGGGGSLHDVHDLEKSKGLPRRRYPCCVKHASVRAKEIVSIVLVSIETLHGLTLERGVQSQTIR